MRTPMVLSAKRSETGSTPPTGSTVPINAKRTESPQTLVIGLHVIPAGPQYLFEDFQPSKGRQRYLMIGTADTCHIRLTDPRVSTKHCNILWKKGHTYVDDLDSKNGVWIGNRLVRTCEIHAGDVLTIGSTRIAVIGANKKKHAVLIAAANHAEFIHEAVRVHGSIRAAAEAIGIPYSTLRDWIGKK